jgi:hypothetical protein
MRSRQRGATFLGMVVIIAIIGFALYAAIRLMPLYLEYMAVVRAMEQTAKENVGSVTGPQDLIVALDRRWTVEDIHTIGTKDVGNVSLVAEFDKTVRVGGGATSD